MRNYELNFKQISDHEESYCHDHLRGGGGGGGGGNQKKNNFLTLQKILLKESTFFNKH